MPRRSQQLDVLRGIAIILVLFRHPVVSAVEAGSFGRLSYYSQQIGWTGVDLFFVLSGFLIGGLLFQEIKRTGHLAVGRFLIRRGFKIWPAYFVFLAVVMARDALQAPTAWTGIKPLLPNLLHIQNYLGTPQLHTWSLSVEEHFYLMLPLLLVVLCRVQKVHWVPAMIAVICVLCLVFRLMKVGTTFSLFTHMTPTHLRMDSLCFGVLLAYIKHLRPDLLAFVPRARIPLLVIGLLLLAPMLILGPDRPFVWTIGFTAIYLAYGCILLACIEAESGVLGFILTGPPAKLLGFIGFFSYSIYLWHIPVARDALQAHSLGLHGPIRWVVLMTAYILLATFVGWLGAKIVEQPALAIRDRWFPSKVQNSTPVLQPAEPVAGRAVEQPAIASIL